MRSSFEQLKSSSSCIAKLTYALIRVAHLVLPARRRAWLQRMLLKATHYVPKEFRPTLEYGLNTEPRSLRVVVSLTSYPKRINTVHRVVRTLLVQTFKPDKVVLWLGEDRFPGKEADLPRELLRLRDFGLTIRWCKDMRSYTKLLPALQEFPDDIIITVDDDYFYRRELVANLYASYLRHPQDVHCNIIARVIRDQKGNALPPSNWKLDGSQARGSRSFSNTLLGFGAVLYPPRSFDSEVFNRQVFEKISPYADDFWFWAMAVKNNVKIKMIESPVIPFSDNCSDQSEALLNVNGYVKGLNDDQFVAILDAYPEVHDRLLRAIQKDW